LSYGRSGGNTGAALCSAFNDFGLKHHETQPMLEVLAYLRENGFKNFIVSGGGIEFMRVWTEAAYGIPPEQVIGSSTAAKKLHSWDLNSPSASP
jgi:hypothetical protein